MHGQNGICTNLSHNVHSNNFNQYAFDLNRKGRRQCTTLVTKMNCFNIPLVRACTVAFVPMSSKIQSCAIMNIYFRGFAPAIFSNEGSQLEVNKQDLLRHETAVCELRRVK